MAQKLLLKEAAAAVGLTQNALYQLSRQNRVPFLCIGTKRVFDMDLLEKSLHDMAMANVKPEQSEIQALGKLRRIQA